MSASVILIKPIKCKFCSAVAANPAWVEIAPQWQMCKTCVSLMIESLAKLDPAVISDYAIAMAQEGMKRRNGVS